MKSSVNSVAPVVMKWSLRTSASVEETWRLLADTDRFNRSLGLNWEFSDRVGSDGAVERRGRMRFLGVEVGWDERAFDFVAPDYFHIERVFSGGPASRYTVDLRLTADGPETQIDYVVTTFPRSALTKPMIALHLKIGDRRQLDEVFTKCLAILSGEGGELLPAPPKLQPEAQRRLEQMRDTLQPPELAQALFDHIQRDGLREQIRIGPRRFARRWGLDEEAVLLGFLDAAKMGVLTLQWDLLCPSCHGVKVSFERLQKDRAAHCSSCNIRFDAGFPAAVEVSFRPSRAIRDFQVVTRCMANPRGTPHIVARQRLEPGEVHEWTLGLPVGGYRIRAAESLVCAYLEVREAADARAVCVDLYETSASPDLLAVAVGAVNITVRSRLDVPTWVIVERRWRPAGALTAGEFLGHPKVRERLPDGALGPDLNVDVTRTTVVVTEAFAGEAVVEHLQKTVEEWGPTSVTAAGRELITTWPTFDSALESIAKLEGALDACSSAGSGLAVRVGPEHDGCVWGEVVAEAQAALRSSLPGRTAVSGVNAGDPEVVSSLERRAQEAHLVPGPEVGGRKDFLVKFSQAPDTRRLFPRGDESPMEALVGARFADRYTVGKILGRGGFGVVFEATDADGAAVVLKVLDSKLTQDPVTLQMFFNEARACSKLDHPNVVSVIDFGHSADGRLFIAMERLEGLDLSRIVSRGRTLSPWSVCLVADGVLAGLEAAHAAGIVHRDLKPANIFICREADGAARVKLIDFGIAADLQDRDVDANAHVGTFRYMSPEQLGVGTLSGQSDLYSLGLVMYRLLSGDVPYGSRPPMGVVAGRMGEPVPPLSEKVDARLPDLLLAAIDGCLQLDAEDRIPNAAAARDLIQRVISAERLDASLLASLLELRVDDEEIDSTPDTTVDPTLLSQDRPQE